MFSWPDPQRRPVIVAHRGSSADFPENTLAAFRHAFADGATAIELDVHLTGDNHIVVIHDDTLQRTTSGKGSVGKTSFKKIRSLSAGRWFSRSCAGEHVPTLGEVIRLIDTTRGLNIELKQKPGLRGTRLLVDLCCELIAANRAHDRVLVSSFHHEYLRYLRHIDSTIALGMLYHPIKHRFVSPIRICKSLKAQYLILSGSAISPAIVSKAQGQGISVGEYTINTSSRLTRALRMDVTAVYTDTPRLVSSLLNKA